MNWIIALVLAFVLALVFFGLALFADRYYLSEWPAKIFFLLIGLPLIFLAWWYVIHEIIPVIYSPIPKGKAIASDDLKRLVELRNEMKPYISYFIFVPVVVVSAIQGALSKFVKAVDGKNYWGIAIGTVGSMLLFNWGFKETLNYISVIFGIVGTVVGIFVGIKTLRSVDRKSDEQTNH